MKNRLPDSRVSNSGVWWSGVAVARWSWSTKSTYDGRA